MVPTRRPRMGRTKYTPERIATILDVLRTSGTRRLAYEIAGIDASTFETWMQRKPEFTARVREAESAAEREYVKVIHDAARGERSKKGGWVRLPDWRAALAWLERQRQAEWGRYERIEHTGPDGGPLQIQSEIIVYELPDNGREDATALPVTARGSTNGRRALTNGDGPASGGSSNGSDDA